MTQNFVRYGPEVEQPEPDFERSLQAVLDDMKQHMRGSLETEGVGLVVRNAHAKGYGLARGEVEILSGIPNNTRRVFTPNRGAMKPWFDSQTERIMSVTIGSWALSPALA